MNKRIVILGASGFVGRAVSSLFLQKKANVGLYSKHKGVLNGNFVEPVDISKKGALWDCLNRKVGISTIIYLSSKVPIDITNSPWSVLPYNISMHKQVIECWKRLNCHLVYVSTCSVYGQSPVLPRKEDNPVIPDDYYSISKFVGELLFQQKAKENKLPLTIFRLNAPYGYKTSHKTVVNIFIEQALMGKDLVLWGSGQREQDFMYIDDAARAFWLCCKNKKYGIFNIATGMSITMGYLARLIVKLTGAKSKILYSDRSDPENNFRVAINISKAKQQLGFLPLYSLENGLKKCIAEYKDKSYETIKAS